jgi:aminomethyltransferase
VVRVGYARGPEIARRLEANNIICNFQAGPDEEGFSAAGSLRMGVSEMTRWGMRQDDFRALAGLIRDVVVDDADAVERVKTLRSAFTELKFCFDPAEYSEVMTKIRAML